MRKTYSAIGIAVLTLIITLMSYAPAQAQLILAKGLYRVVEIDRDKTRIGICNLDADPNVRQNWIIIKINTKVTLREQNKENGTLRDVAINPIELFSILYKGDVVRVSGGRDWKGHISAKSLLIYPDDPNTWYQE
ncbi:MAG: hypothetical protein Q4F00_01210 [bacterium]|nr:hypothetical protein [bacterium]